MNIAYLTSGLSQLRGGPLLIYNIAQHIAKSNSTHIVNVYSFEEKKIEKNDFLTIMSKQPDNLMVNFVETHFLKENNKINVIKSLLQDVRTFLPYSFFPSALMGFFAVRAVYVNPPMEFSKVFINRIREKVDIIHVGAWNTPYTQTIAMLRRFQKKWFDKKFLCHSIFHLVPISYYSTLSKDFGIQELINQEMYDSLKKKFLRSILSEYDAITVSTPFEYEFLSHLGMNRVELVGEGIDLEFIESNINEIKQYSKKLKDHLRSENIFLFAGPRSYSKGYYDVIRSFYNIWRQNELENPKLIVLGRSLPKIMGKRGEKIAHIEHKLIEKGALLEFEKVNEEKKFALIEACDVVLIPSVLETIPLVFLEAWALKKPVIGAKTPTVESIIKFPGDGGLLIDFGDVNQLTQCMLKLMSDRKFALSSAKIGWEKVIERYNLKTVCTKLAKIYTDLTKR